MSTHTVRIGGWTGEVRICEHEGCRSASGPTGLCWAHREAT